MTQDFYGTKRITAWPQTEPGKPVGIPSREGYAVKYADGYTSGNVRKMVDKGLLDMEDVKEIWRSPLIPNGPIVVRKDLDADVRAKFKEFMMNLPKNNPDCFSAIQGGTYNGFVEVDHSFYETIVAARKAKIGG